MKERVPDTHYGGVGGVVGPEVELESWVGGSVCDSVVFGEFGYFVCVPEGSAIRPRDRMDLGDTGEEDRQPGSVDER